jgi:hypothetical protein
MKLHLDKISGSHFFPNSCFKSECTQDLTIPNTKLNIQSSSDILTYSGDESFIVSRNVVHFSNTTSLLEPRGVFKFRTFIPAQEELMKQLVVSAPE